MPYVEAPPVASRQAERPRADQAPRWCASFFSGEAPEVTATSTLGLRCERPPIHRMLGAGPAILPVTGPTARRAKMGRNNGMDHRVCRREHGDRATADKANTPSPVSDFRSAPPAHTGAPLVTPYLIRDAMVAESTAPGQRGQSPSQCWAPGHHVNLAVRHQSHSSTTLLSVPRRFRHRQEYKWWVPVDPSKAVALGVPAGPPRLGPRGSWREHCCRQAPVTWCHGTIIAP